MDLEILITISLICSLESHRVCRVIVGARFCRRRVTIICKAKPPVRCICSGLSYSGNQVTIPRRPVLIPCRGIITPVLDSKRCISVENNQ